METLSPAHRVLSACGKRTLGQFMSAEQIAGLIGSAMRGEDGFRGQAVMARRSAVVGEWSDDP